ncbi:MAG: hypothetical protein JJT95_09270, partial [Pararhodobacter sp.]|nr:hypothetical protein [Pararhodobacter sp.]
MIAAEQASIPLAALQVWRLYQTFNLTVDRQIVALLAWRGDAIDRHEHQPDAPIRHTPHLARCFAAQLADAFAGG